MKALALACALWLGFPDDVCPDCTPRRLCKPHAAEVKSGLKEVERDLKDDDPAVRREALARAAALNAGHTNAPSKDVTKAIAAALEDDELAIRTEAAALLRAGQDPDTAVKALVASSTDVPKLLGEIKADHPEALPTMEFAVAVVDSVAAYRDDRSVEALGNILERNPESVYGDVVYRIVDGLTALAAKGGVEAVLAYHQLMEGLGVFPELERYIHDSLTRMAAARGLDGAPPWSDDGVSRAWKDWFDDNARRLPKKLGKAKLEPNDG